MISEQNIFPLDAVTYSETNSLRCLNPPSRARYAPDVSSRFRLIKARDGGDLEKKRKSRSRNFKAISLKIVKILFKKMREFEDFEIRVIAREVLLRQLRLARSPDDVLYKLFQTLIWTKDIWFNTDEAKRFFLKSFGAKININSHLYHGLIIYAEYPSEKSKFSWGPYRVEERIYSLCFNLGTETVLKESVNRVAYSDNYLLLEREKVLVEIFYKNLENKIYSGYDFSSHLFFTISPSYYLFEKEDKLLICLKSFFEIFIYILENGVIIMKCSYFYTGNICPLSEGFLYGDEKVFFQSYLEKETFLLNDIPSVILQHKIYPLSTSDVDVIIIDDILEAKFELIVLDINSHSILWKMKSASRIKIHNMLVVATEGIFDIITGRKIMSSPNCLNITSISRGEKTSTSEWKIYAISNQ